MVSLLGASVWNTWEPEWASPFQAQPDPFGGVGKGFNCFPVGLPSDSYFLPYLCNPPLLDALTPQLQQQVWAIAGVWASSTASSQATVSCTIKDLDQRTMSGCVQWAWVGWIIPCFSLSWMNDGWAFPGSLEEWLSSLAARHLSISLCRLMYLLALGWSYIPP